MKQENSENRSIKITGEFRKQENPQNKRIQETREFKK